MRSLITICVETLNVKGMLKNPKLAKAIQEISHREVGESPGFSHGEDVRMSIYYLRVYNIWWRFSSKVGGNVIAGHRRH